MVTSLRWFSVGEILNYITRQLTEPLKLTTHGYNTPYDALRDKTQSILTQIVAHLDYSAMVSDITPWEFRYETSLHLGQATVIGS